MDERQRKLNDTRAILDWLETHPEIALPSEVEYGLSISAMDGKDDALKLVRAFGTCDKRFAGDTLVISKKFGSTILKAILFRNQVCERVVISTEVVPEKIEPEHVREIVEWKCDPILESEAA